MVGSKNHNILEKLSSETASPALTSLHILVDTQAVTMAKQKLKRLEKTWVDCLIYRSLVCRKAGGATPPRRSARRGESTSLGARPGGLTFPEVISEAEANFDTTPPGNT